MVFLISAAAAIFLGVGWVVQQRVATKSDSDSDGLLSWTVLFAMATSGLWWLGIFAMTVGQSLSSWGLQFGPVSSVEPVLVGSLLVAFTVSAIAAHARPRWQELTGPAILIVALIVFLAVADPREGARADPRWPALLIATIAAGVMYALQDVATRGAIVFTEHHPLIALLSTLWPWVLLTAATAGVLLTQAAFRAERLDWALPPTAAAQPIAGIVIGVALLRDRLSASGVALAFEGLCLVAVLGALLLIGRSPAFGD